MKDYVLDANAVLRFFRNLEGAERVSALLEQADRRQATLRISLVNLAEVLYVYARFTSMAEAQKAVETLEALVKFVSPDKEQTLAVAELRSRYKLGLADCFAAELALRTGATLVTADPEFAKLGRQLKVMELPKFRH